MLDPKKELVLNDYYKCIGTFEICKLIYNNKSSFEILDTDTEEIKKFKQGQKEAFLSQLGIVGEKALKYIFGLKLLSITNSAFQSKSLEEFDSCCHGTNKRLNEIANYLKIDMNTTEYKSLLDYEDDNKQKAHNFDYWYNVVNVFLDNYMDTKFKDYLIKKKESDSLLKYCKNNNAFYSDFYYEDEVIEEPTIVFQSILNPSFTDLIYSGVRFPKNYVVTQKELDMLKSHKTKVIKDAGDSFVRFRYAFNNINNTKDLNIDDVYCVIEDLTEFIKYIHENNNNLEFDLIKCFAKDRAIRLHKELRKSKEEINNLFNLDVYYDCIEAVLFHGNYSIKYLESLIALGLPKEDLSTVVSYGLTAYEIKLFFKKGITDYREMNQIKLDYLKSFEEDTYYRR